MNLRNEAGEYNLLAELLSNRNNIPFIFVKFQGENKASIYERNDYGYGCILAIYGKIKNRLQAENIYVFMILQSDRKKTNIYIDYDCVNEAILNVLVHNYWTITEPLQNSFMIEHYLAFHSVIWKLMRRDYNPVIELYVASEKTYEQTIKKNKK